MKIEGGCLCGKVRYSADAEPVFVGVCHCTNCQKGIGSAFAAVVALPKPALSVTGSLKTFTDRGDSGKAMFRRFCPECGSPLIDEAEVMPGMCNDHDRDARRCRAGSSRHGDLLRQRTALGKARRRHAAFSENAGFTRLMLSARGRLTVTTRQP